MADFHNAFEAIDEDGSGEITIQELQHYMMKNNYKESFVSKWLTLFDGYKSGIITYEHYCNTLGLTPKQRTAKKAAVEETVKPAKKAAVEETVKPAKKAAIEETAKPAKKAAIEEQEEIIQPVSNATESATPDTSSGEPQQQKRVLKKPQSYQVQSMKRASKHRNKSFSQHKRRLRASIRPGVVLILLTGVHRGKRVVFLRQLPSGLLLVTGPFKINGCPLRRVHQSLVIATRTQLDLGDFSVPEHLGDEYFSRRESDDDKRTNSDPNNIFARAKKQYILKETRKQDQKLVDSQVLRAIKKRADKTTLVQYLRSLFSLSSHDYPHKMQF